MIELSREIRFALVSPEELANQQDSPPPNSWSAWPATDRIVPHLKLAAVLIGSPDPNTGYLCNIKIVDQRLREIVTRRIIPEFGIMESNRLPVGSEIVRAVFDEFQRSPIDGTELQRISLSLSPYLSFAINAKAPDMIQLTQQFEFSAAHRLHCDTLSAEENKATFGKCNNPAGHGHNYVLEVTIEESTNAKESTQGEGGSSSGGLGDFEKTVKATIIDRLDHKHLNEDIDYFRDVNPTVENMAIAIWNWLEAPIGSSSLPNEADRKLHSIKLFETPKTWAQYFGDR